MINESLEVADLVSHTDLALSGGRFQLGWQAVTDPNFSVMSGHHIPDHVFAAVETNDMQNCTRRAENPLPPVSAIDPAARLVRVHHGTLLDFGLDRSDLLQGRSSGALHDLVNRTLAELHAIQTLESRLGPYVTHMLFLPIIHDHGLQAHTECAVHIQSGRRLTNLLEPAARTQRFVLP